MSSKDRQPTKEQMKYIGRIAVTCGLFACKMPKTEAEADKIIWDFLYPGRPYLRAPIDVDKLWVKFKKDEDEAIKYD